MSLSRARDPKKKTKVAFFKGRTGETNSWKEEEEKRRPAQLLKKKQSSKKGILANPGAKVREVRCHRGKDK